MSERIAALFPGLRATPYRITSPATRDYNCVAWATGETGRWWWPESDDACFWPSGAPMEVTIDAFVAAFATLGYVPCAGDELEPGFEKVALFASGAVPTHVARQLPGGRWTSKLGRSEDIEHDLHALSGEAYGTVVVVLKRPTSTGESSTG